MSDLASETVTIAELAAALGRTPSWLRRHWRRLHEADGMPRMIPGGLTFPRRAVRAWLAAGGFAPIVQREPANDDQVRRDPVAAANRFLRERVSP